MADILNWTDLLNAVSNKQGVFDKLRTKINQTIRSYEKSKSSFNLLTIQKNHLDIFNIYKLTYEQLLIEKDITDLLVEIPSLSKENTSVTFNMIGVGKWIKFHCGNSSRLFFFDEEKTALSDKSLADFLNKIDIIRNEYKYFGKEPIIYYKFKTLPSDDIINYFYKFNIRCSELGAPTDTIDYPREPNNKVLVDQSIILTLCSNLSYGLSTSFYETSSDKTMEVMVKNKNDLDNFLQDKTILMNSSVYEQTKIKFNTLAGTNEKKRFDELCKRIIVVPDQENQRFYYLKNIELVCVSVAEKENAMIITGNQRFCNKINKYYQEIFYKLFGGAQLAESKYN